MKPITKNKIGGDWLIFGAMFIFGGYSLFLRFFPQIPTALFLFAFQAVGVIFFLPFAARHGIRSITVRSWLQIAALTIAAILNDLFYFAAFRETTVANAAVAHQMVSIFLVILTPLIIRERTSRNEWIALFVSLIGIGILYGGVSIANSKEVWGITLGLLSALAYAFVVILYGIIPRRGLSVSALNFWRYLFSSIVLLPIFLANGNAAIARHNLLPLALFGITFAFAAAGIHTLGISRTRPLHATIIGKTEPVLAAIYAATFLGEIPSVSVIVGGIFIVGAGVWLAMKKEVIA